MKFLIILFTIALSFCKAQIVFCPQGAEWRYNFFYAGFGNPAWQSMFLEKIKYVRDSTIANQQYKVLQHKNFYLKCNDGGTKLTLIKQSGDTVFFRNKYTLHTWQILYNFNVQPGQKWFTQVVGNTYSIPSSLVTHTIVVDSIKYVNLNSFNLKQIFAKHQFPYSAYSYSVTYTERLGCSMFLFNFENATFGTCDYEWFNRNLCYTDNQFGTIQYSGRPCDFENLVGINKIDIDVNEINVFPNPNNGELKIRGITAPSQIYISDVLGKTVKTYTVSQQNTIDIKDLPRGVYFLKAENEKGKSVFKIIKD